MKLKGKRIKKRWLTSKRWEYYYSSCLYVYLHKQLQTMRVACERAQMMRSGCGHWLSLFILLGWRWASERPHRPLNPSLKGDSKHAHAPHTESVGGKEKVTSTLCLSLEAHALAHTCTRMWITCRVQNILKNTPSYCGSARRPQRMSKSPSWKPFNVPPNQVHGT